MKLESWVYRVLIKFHNVALPYACNDMDRKTLKKHLERKVGFEVRLRVAYISTERTSYTPKHAKDVKRAYLIAEEK